MHIFSKLGGCGSKIESATPLWSFKFKGAWQAQFLSHNLLILENCIFFEDKQMILVSFIKIHKGKKVIKFGHSCHIHVWVIPGLSHFIISCASWTVSAYFFSKQLFFFSMNLNFFERTVAYRVYFLLVLIQENNTIYLKTGEKKQVQTCLLSSCLDAHNWCFHILTSMVWL